MNMYNVEDLPQDALVVDNVEDAFTIAKILIENNNAVLITREEKLWCINWIWCPNGEANRNDVIFTSKEEYEYFLDREE